VISSHFKDLTIFRKFKSLVKDTRVFEFVQENQNQLFLCGIKHYLGGTKEVIFINGLEEGFSLFNYPSTIGGMCLSKGFKRKDLNEGYWVYYWSNENIQYQGCYVFGKKNGYWIHNGFEGNKISENIYDLDEILVWSSGGKHFFA